MTKKIIKITLIGAYGTNVGDNAILLGILRQMDRTLKESGYTPRFYIFTNYPDHLKNVLKNQIHELNSAIRFLKITNVPKMLITLANSDILICGGGGLIVDDWHLIFSSIYLIPIVWAYLFNKFITIYSIGASTPRSKIGRFLTSRILSIADIITVRDVNSRKALLGTGIRKPIYLYPDPALLLVPKKYKKIEKYLNYKRNTTRIILSLRYIFKYYSENIINHNCLLDNFRRIIGMLIKLYNATIFFIPFNKHPKKWFENDLIIGEQLKERVNDHSRFIIIDDIDNPEEIIGLITNADMLIGTRLHSLILASVANTPIIGISGDQKVSNFLDTLGLKKFSISPNDQQFQERIIGLINNILQDKKRARKFRKFLKNKRTMLSLRASKLPEKVIATYEVKFDA
ncbi:MAG: polysaccharide pyruvyl transferase family protein [Thermosipho sp. (in: Bacteria)]|nr:polysaccharide pyruvyl transferase family protein [Thermosipho sp. (in: thermotogales)]